MDFSYLLGGTPPGYPTGWQVSDVNQYPVMPEVTYELVPAELIAFNDRGRSTSPIDDCLHFYKDDSKFMGVLANPLSYVSSFVDFKFLITPDVTITSGMPPWQKLKISGSPGQLEPCLPLEVS